MNAALESVLHSRVNCKLITVFACMFPLFFFLSRPSKVAYHSSCLFPTSPSESLLMFSVIVDIVPALSTGITLWSAVVGYVRVLNLHQSLKENCT